MSYLKASGIISDHLNMTPVSGIGFGGQPFGQPYGVQPFGQPYGVQPFGQPFGVQPIGMNVGMTPFGPTGMGVGLRDGMGNNFNMINSMGRGGLTPVRFKKGLGSLTVTHPIGMPIATSYDPLNPFNTVVSNPWGSLGSDLASLDPIVKKGYTDKGIDIVIVGNNSSVNKVIECLTAHLESTTATTPATTPATPATTAATIAKAAARSAAPAAPILPFPPFLPKASPPPTIRAPPTVTAAPTAMEPTAMAPPTAMSPPTAMAPPTGIATS